jgi:hypothetical protein
MAYISLSSTDKGLKVHIVERNGALVGWIKESASGIYTDFVGDMFKGKRHSSIEEALASFN